jgi:pyrimidine-specific ribonucleoside hydrolase
MKRNFFSFTLALAVIILVLTACHAAGGASPPATSTASKPALVATPGTEEYRPPVVLLQDGAPDDITAAMYFMLNEHVNLVGIVVTNGETHPSRALAKWLDYVYAYMGWTNVPVVAGCDCAVDPHANQFPEGWRSGADDFWGIPLPTYTGEPPGMTGVQLILLLSQQYPGELVVVITGPHTDLAIALRDDPALKERIRKVVIMGGAVDVAGNIQADDPSQTNTTAEWNIWVDPLAAAEVFASGIPIDVIPMDPVPEVELDRSFQQMVGAVNLPGANLMSTLWSSEFGWYNTDHIWIYDVLAAIAVDRPELYTWNYAPITVDTTPGPDQGRTVKQAGTSDIIRYAIHADGEGVLAALYRVFPPR